MFKRKITKVSSSIKALLKSGKNPSKFLVCKQCDKVEVEVPFDTGAVTCSYCVQRSVEPPKMVIQVPDSEKFPRGWALKVRYVHTDGRVFQKGKETGEVIVPQETETEKKKISKKNNTSKKKVVKKKTPKRRK